MLKENPILFQLLRNVLNFFPSSVKPLSDILNERKNTCLGTPLLAKLISGPVLQCQT